MYGYDIILNKKMIAFSGDEEFTTIEEAKADAKNYIISDLENEYKARHNDFEVAVWEIQYAN